MTTFSDLDLAAPILSALEAEGYAAPTPIQAAAIPAVKDGKDLLGIAQTGTGKTAAFALPILHRLASNPRPAPRKGCRALILSPTRELATQIGDSFRTYGSNLNLNVAVIFGGVAHRPQIQALARGLDVLVATPGRLIDHMMERNADIRSTEILVLDEADQMLDLGFIKPIRRIIGELSQRRQTLLFSATMPDEIAGLVREFMNEPVRVAVTPVATTAERVSQRVIFVPAPLKRDLLAELLANEAMSRTLVFTRTKRGADKVAKHLEAAGIRSAAIHGNKSQKQREIALDDFKNGTVRTLVATDIAARGIDIDSVSHVVNFELPEVPEAYVHRIGRTARAGASGSAISFCDREERDLLFRIEKLIRQRIPSETRAAGSISAAPVVATVESADERSAPQGEGDSYSNRQHRHRQRDRRPEERGRHRQPGGNDNARGHNGHPGRSVSADGDRRDGGRRGEHPGRSHQGRTSSRPPHERDDQTSASRESRGEHRRGGDGHRASQPAARGSDGFPEFGAAPVRPGSRGGEHHHRGEDRGRSAHRGRPEQRGHRHGGADGDRRGGRDAATGGRPHHRSGDGASRKDGHRTYRGRGNGTNQPQR